MKTVLWIVGVLAIFVVAIAATRQPILEGRFLEAARPLYMLVAPPADLYTPLVISPAVLDVSPASYRFSFEHKYAGSHKLGISVEKQVPMPVDTYDWGARYRVVFSVEGKTLKTEIVGASPSPWWRQNESGFSLLSFEVPRDLPRGKLIACEILVLEPGQGFHSKYGSSSFYIRKSGEI
jgi:hypothetical protein